MKHFKTQTLFTCLLFSAFSVESQNVTITRGGQTKMALVKSSEPNNFIAGGDHYFFTEYTEHAVRTYHLQSFDSKGAFLADAVLEINQGVFNNTYSIDEVLGFGNKAYAMIEHLDKPSGKNTLLARVIDNKGKIATSEVEVMSIPFEKIMNSGFNYSAVSSDNKTLAVVGEMMYVKDQPAEFKVALFNQDMKKIKEGDFKLPGENTKNKSISVKVANDGTVYLIKKGMTKKGDITLAVYQWSSVNSSDVKEYLIELTPPSQLLNFTYEVNSNNELIVSGLYYERRTLTVGETQAAGVFYFTNKGKSEKVLSVFKLDAPVDNLTARKILINGNTVFLTAEQYKEERITPPASAAGSMSNFDWNYNYTHKSDFVIALDVDGNKKFQLELAKDFSARDFDRQFYSGYFICNGKLTVMYNDLTKKYIKDDSYYANQVPVLVQITNDGLLQSPVVFKNELKLEQYFVLYPSRSLQDSNNQISILMGNSQFEKIISVKVD